jgi:hypothetical protein
VITVNTALGGFFHWVANAGPATDFHEFELECVEAAYTIRVDGQVVYGPAESSMRPTAIVLGNAALAFWYPTDWSSFSVDYIEVDVPGPVPVTPESWGAIKARFRVRG